MTTVETSPGVTVEDHSTSNNNNEPAADRPNTGTYATQARARARARLTLPDGHRALLCLWAEEAGNTFRRVSGWLENRSVSQEHPPSHGARFAYARAAPMAGHSKVLRLVQRLDAYLIATPGVQVFYLAAWIWDRPLRRWTTVLIVLAVWLLH